MGGSAPSRPQPLNYNKITDINESALKKDLTREESAKLDLENNTPVTSPNSQNSKIEVLPGHMPDQAREKYKKYLKPNLQDFSFLINDQNIFGGLKLKDGYINYQRQSANSNNQVVDFDKFFRQSEAEQLEELFVYLEKNEKMISTTNNLSYSYEIETELYNCKSLILGYEWQKSPENKKLFETYFDSNLKKVFTHKDVTYYKADNFKNKELQDSLDLLTSKL